MIIRNSSHFRVFNANGVDFKKSFIFKFLSKFGTFENLFKLFKLLNLKNLRRFNLRNLVKSLCTFILSKKNFSSFSNKLKKKFFLIYFQVYIEYLFYTVTKKRKMFFDLFGKYIFQKDRKTFLIKAFFGKKKNTFLNNIFVTYNYKQERLPFLKNYYENINLKAPKRNFYGTLNDKINRSIYINAEGFSLFTGSITPFGKKKLSWFASTGLKGDIECNEINFWDKQVNQEKFENFSKGDDNHVIFKVKNFKNKIKSRFQATIRHAFYYKMNHFIGIQRFQSENIVNFNLFQNFSKISEDLNFLNIKDCIFNLDNFNPKISLNTFFLKKKVFKLIFGLKLSKLKIQFISFYVLKNLLKVYLYLRKIKFTIFNYSSFYLKSIVYMQKIYQKLMNLCKTFIQRLIIFDKKFYFIKKKKYKMIKKDNNYLLKNIFLNKIFSEKIIEKFLDFSFNNYFLDIFLIRQEFYPYIIKLRESANLKPEVVYKLQEKISPRPYWFKTYNFIYLYFYFLIDCKLNFRLFMMKNSIKTFYQKKMFYQLIKPFKMFKRAWRFRKFINFVDSKKYFSLFLKRISFSFKNNIYLYFLLKKNNTINLNLKFYLCNLMVFIQKLIYKHKGNDFLYFNNMLKLSNFFLGKWFYYRQINKIIDNESRSFFNTDKPAIVLNLNTRESSVYNLKKLSNLGSKTFKKLDNYFNKNSNLTFLSLFFKKKKDRKIMKVGNEIHSITEYNNYSAVKLNKKAPVDKFLKNKSSLKRRRKLYRFYITKSALFRNIKKYRDYRWSNKFRLMKDPLEIGYLFKLPKLFRRRGRRKINFFKRKIFKGNLAQKRVRWRYFLRRFKKYYKNELLTYSDLGHDLSHSFICLLNKKKTYYSEQNFWFKKKIIKC